MLWRAITSRGVGPLYKIDGNMDKFQYVRINDASTMLYPQDNDPEHTTHLIKQWFLNNSASVLDWSSCHPDLNPIENLLQVVKKYVRQPKLKRIGFNPIFIGSGTILSMEEVLLFFGML